MLVVAGALWTSIIQKANVINNVHVRVFSDYSEDRLLTVPQVVTGPSLGIRVDFATGLWLLWASAACMFASIIPYLIRYARSPRHRSCAGAKFCTAAVPSADDSRRNDWRKDSSYTDTFTASRSANALLPML